MQDGEPVKFLYREKPIDKDDSGWRVFSGTEDQAYVENPDNFLIHNASSIIERHPDVAGLLVYDYPIAFDWNENGERFERSRT